MACGHRVNKMKKILLIVLLLIVGCFKEPINFEQMLVERDNVYYTKDTNKPYSGAVFSLYDDGKKKSEGAFKNGYYNGKWFLTTKTEDGEKITYLNFKGKEKGQSMTASVKFMGKNKFISDDMTLRRKIK